MSRRALAVWLLAAACTDGSGPPVATGFPDDLAAYECWMHARWRRCAAPEVRSSQSPVGELGGPGGTCSFDYWFVPNGICHDPTALEHCLRGIERQARTCDDPMPAACAHVVRPC
jgi:hypothetical protein